MEPMRMLNIPNTEASNKILGRYGGSVVKATPSARGARRYIRARLRAAHRWHRASSATVRSRR